MIVHLIQFTSSLKTSHFSTILDSTSFSEWQTESVDEFILMPMYLDTWQKPCMLYRQMGWICANMGEFVPRHFYHNVTSVLVNSTADKMTSPRDKSDVARTHPCWHKATRFDGTEKQFT
jgi:hypothetical protein